MGQRPSKDAVYLETRVENPADDLPRGLALIAHGRLGGTYDDPVVRTLARYLVERRSMRVVTWNARGIGHSGGGNEWSDFGIWMGEAAVNDYTRLLKESLDAFIADYPDVNDAELFICGYSAGATFAAAVRPPQNLARFRPPRYILISYPVELAPCIGVFMTGGYFRALEALVQGEGWEGNPHPEGPVTGVLTLTGSGDRGPFYYMWTGILSGKNRRGNLKQVVVEWADHVWRNKVHCIPEEIDKWLNGE